MRDGTETATSDHRRPAFRGGVRPAVGLFVFFVLWTLLTNAFLATSLEPNPDPAAVHALSAASKTVQLGATALVLRAEGVRPPDIGLSVALVRPAVVTVVCLIAALNAVGALLVALGGESASVGFFVDLRTPPEDYSLFTVITGITTYYLFVGPAEELAFRGYFQNKFAALAGGPSDRLRTVVGIAAAALTFAALHVPLLLHQGVVGVGSVIGILVVNFLPGVLFGAVYAVTRNLYLVALLHGIADWLPVFVVPTTGAWPVRPIFVVLVAVSLPAYRRWVTGASDSPATRGSADP